MSLKNSRKLYPYKTYCTRVSITYKDATKFWCSISVQWVWCHLDPSMWTFILFSSVTAKRLPNNTSKKRKRKMLRVLTTRVVPSQRLCHTTGFPWRYLVSSKHWKATSEMGKHYICNTFIIHINIIIMTSYNYLNQGLKNHNLNCMKLYKCNSYMHNL